MTDLFQCCNFLKDFISEKLDGDIEKFITAYLTYLSLGNK